MAIGQKIFVGDSALTAGGKQATFQVVSLPSATSVELEWLQYPDDSAGGSTLVAGVILSPTGPIPVFSPPANLTNSTTGTPGATLTAGVGVQQLSIPHTFIGGTAAVEPVTTMVIPYKFKILSFNFVTEVALVGAAGSRVANMEIGTTDLTGGVCTILIAATAVGTVTPATAVTALNTGSAGDSISIEIASGGTQFTAGSGTFVINIQNMDLADAVASLNASITSINATL